jgi:hypothetical protein
VLARQQIKVSAFADRVLVARAVELDRLNLNVRLFGQLRNGEDGQILGSQAAGARSASGAAAGEQQDQQWGDESESWCLQGRLRYWTLRASLASQMRMVRMPALSRHANAA